MFSLAKVATLATLLLPAVASAVPFGSVFGLPPGAAVRRSAYETCTIENSRGVPTIPPNVTIVDGEKPLLVFLARGTQNYTCEKNPDTYKLEWTSIGAVADFYDASSFICLHGSEFFTFAALAIIPFPVKDGELFDKTSIAARHFFRERGRPTFKLTSDDQPEFTGKTAGSTPSPIDPKIDVAWLEIAKVANNIPGVNTFYRVNTAGGQPDKLSCEKEGEGNNLEVPYSAYYWAHGY